MVSNAPLGNAIINLRQSVTAVYPSTLPTEAHSTSSSGADQGNYFLMGGLNSAGPNDQAGDTLDGKITVIQGTTTTITGSSANPSSFGHSVTFTATVWPQIGTFDNGGTVTFNDNGTSIGTGTLSGNGTSGQATLVSSATLTVGHHPITAVYGGDTNFTASTSTAFDQVVSHSTTTTTVTASGSSSALGTTVTFTATVQDHNATITGTVDFYDGSSMIGTGTLSRTSKGDSQTTMTTSTLSGGTHSITASYCGDGNFDLSSSDTFLQTVNRVGSTTTLTSLSSTSTSGQPVSFTATVHGVSGFTPAGTVTFSDGTTSLGTAALSGGAAVYTTSALTTVGTHTITAVYGGDNDYLAQHFGNPPGPDDHHERAGRKLVHAERHRLHGHLQQAPECHPAQSLRHRHLSNGRVLWPPRRDPRRY